MFIARLAEAGKLPIMVRSTRGGLLDLKSPSQGHSLVAEVLTLPSGGGANMIYLIDF